MIILHWKLQIHVILPSIYGCIKKHSNDTRLLVFTSYQFYFSSLMLCMELQMKIHIFVLSTDEGSLNKDSEDSSTISTAIFYSITSTQKGLQVSYGYHFIGNFFWQFSFHSL